MIYVILAAGLGANFIVFALLFRRLRQLSWQLRDIRAERNSEWILHALQGVTEDHKTSAQAAVGTGFEPSAGPQPVRRKRHLGLYIGGLSGIAATVTEVARHSWRTHRTQLTASAAGAALVAATTIVLIVIERQAESDKGSPSSAPTATATVTSTTSSAPGHTSPSTDRSPSAGGNPTARTPGAGSPTAAGGASGAPIDSEPSAAPSSTASSGVSAEPSSTDSGAPPPSSSVPPPEQPPPSPALCLGLVVLPVVDLTACLAGGG